MIKTEVSADKCTGCGACFNICPVHSIEIVTNQEGFEYPNINLDKCIRCNKCSYVCPVMHMDKAKEVSNIYAAYGLDKNRFESSSGGLASIFAGHILSQGGNVCGVAFDEQFLTYHLLIENENELEKIRGSKYVQTKISEIYTKTKERLDWGLSILFFGTPCQVSGLKYFLGRPYDNLFTVDLVCHGIPSPKVWQKYLEFHKENNGAEIEHVNFRDKTTGWRNYSVRIDFKDKTYVKEKHYDDLYMKVYLNNLVLRKSCYNCQFKINFSQADITLGDFWGIEKISQSLRDESGISLLIAHNEIGQELVNRVRNKIYIQEVPMTSTNKEIIGRFNPALFRSVGRPGRREFFFKNIEKMAFEKLEEKCLKTTLYQKIKKFLKQNKFVKNLLENRIKTKVM